MKNKKTYDIFVTHAWRYHDDWTKFCDLLDSAPGFAWRNFSLPWHDPAMDPNSGVGGAFIRDFLETQIIPVDAVILLSGVYTVKSARHWLDLEVELAGKHHKPIIAMPGLGESVVPSEVRAVCDDCADWHADTIVAALANVVHAD